MCGVIGLVYQNHHPRLGLIAAELLRTLEYRGYDSTGAAIQAQGDGAAPDVRLAKGVGAPSVMVHELGITAMSGQVLCGQVRWATFGAVTDENSQPHVVRCHTFLYGAHNGNVTNCDDLKRWLAAEGHAVLSDNDGEMVVHAIEHHFARLLAEHPEAARADPARRGAAMRQAIMAAAAMLRGSYAAVVVDPLTRQAYAIKQGSSLYFGFGSDPVGGRFAIASSDLSSVLKLTRVLLPLSEGEFIEFGPEGHQIYRVRDQGPVSRAPVRSRLRAKDTALSPGFSTFMEQEIAAQPATVAGLVALFSGGSAGARALAPSLEAQDPAGRRELEGALDHLRELYDDGLIRRHFHALCDLPATRRLSASVPAQARDLAGEAGALCSTEAGFLTDLLPMARDRDDALVVRLLDALLEQGDVAEMTGAAARFVALCQEALGAGGRLLCVCCGSSYHAALAAALFFNEIAGVQLLPLLPGEFRGQYARSLRDGDLIIAVSQSGETKDLIDVLNQVIASGRRVPRVALVNNLNSTLAQEKSDLVIPLRCGPEIAVPATKSFISQVAAFYCLAISLGLRLQQPGAAERMRRLPELPALLARTLAETEAAVESAAELLYLRPSMHLLATRVLAVALEGALKVREVVLNHTEGYEGSEFKHGPNTILGKGTIFGPLEVKEMLAALGQVLGRAAEEAARAGAAPAAIGERVRALTASAFSPDGAGAQGGGAGAQVEVARGLWAALCADYPLLYITGPDEQDVHLTVSQINTHKIRGASTVVLAEEHPDLRQAASKPPADNPRYRSVYIALPRTGDTLMTVFSATVALQRLALKMSLAKMAYLDRLGLEDHGVHPDVPKNVSKSITVD